MFFRDRQVFLFRERQRRRRKSGINNLVLFSLKNVEVRLEMDFNGVIRYKVMKTTQSNILTISCWGKDEEHHAPIDSHEIK